MPRHSATAGGEKKKPTYNDRGRPWRSPFNIWGAVGKISTSIKGMFPAIEINLKLNVTTREECEEKLAELIKTMKAEIAEMKKAANV